MNTKKEIEFNIYYDLTDEGELSNYEVSCVDWGETPEDNFSHKAVVLLPKKKQVVLTLRPVKE